MTYLVTNTPVQITGLTALAWNRTVSLDSFVTVPAGAKHVFLTTENINGTGQAYGFQSGDSVEDYTGYAVSGRLKRTDLVPINVAKQISLYTAHVTNLKFYISGYTNHFTDITIQNVGAVVTGSGTFTVDCSGFLPSEAIGGSVYIRVNGKTCHVGKVGTTSNTNVFLHQQRNIEFVELNASRQFEISSTASMVAADVQVIGWAKAGVYTEVTGAIGAETPSTPAVWEDLTSIDNGALAVWRTSTTSGTTQTFRLDTGGVTSPASSFIARLSNPHLVVPNSSTKKTAGVVSATSVQFFHYGSIAADISDANLSSVDPIIEGTLVDAVFDASYTPTDLSITDGVSTKLAAVSSGSGSNWTFTAPSLQDGVVGLKIGTVSVRATDGVGYTNTITSAYSKTDYTAQNITETPAPNNIGAGFTPSVQVGDQFACDASKGAIDQFGVFTTTWEGAQTIWWHSSTDSKWRSLEVITGSSGESGFITSAGLTSLGLTTTGLSE